MLGFEVSVENLDCHHRDLRALERTFTIPERNRAIVRETATRSALYALYAAESAQRPRTGVLRRALAEGSCAVANGMLIQRHRMENRMNRNLPDVSGWQPTASNEDNLRNALMTTCQIAQERIVSRAEAEIRFNIQRFDSGAGVEDIVREELGNLLPQRYLVDAGVADDHHGRTAGDCDVLIRDPLWSPVIKLGATARSRRRHFAIEGIYAAAEIKQTLGLDALDAAMEKMVKVSRLDRSENPYGHITENQHLPYHDQPGMVLNPLHTSVFATRLENGVSFEDVAHRFGAINEMLDRDHMVKMLCVLGAGTVWYSVVSGTPYDADFMRDRSEELILQVNADEPDKAFYRWYALLGQHLTRSVLGLTNVFSGYGSPPPHRETRRYPNAALSSVSG